MPSRRYASLIVTVGALCCAGTFADTKAPPPPSSLLGLATQGGVAGTCKSVAECAQQAVAAAQAAQRAAEQATAQLRATMVGAVVAFNTTICPKGWVAYTPAQGRFIRGIDKPGGTTDPDGQRAPGSLQADMVGPHTHTYDRTELSAHGSFVDDKDHDLGQSIASSTESNSTTGVETRPKNVALLYCVMN